MAQPTADARKQFAKLTRETKPNAKANDAFIAHKWHVLRTHPLIDAHVRELVENHFAAVLAHGAQVPPIPGGVGYGMFYTPAFKTNFSRGTSLYWRIVCPTPPGGNVNTWLYLTAMNRASLGIEAFVSYNGQNDTHFKVFDWARTDHWQTDVPLSKLGDYVVNESAHGHVYQVLPVWNSTYEIGSSGGAEPQILWRNEALLFNHTHGRWDLVYRYDYSATELQQKTGFTGSWGPIVETFQPLYQQTQPMGTLATMLIGENSAGVWGTWHDLGPGDSTIRIDNVGFQLVFLDANHTWAVRS